MLFPQTEEDHGALGQHIDRLLTACGAELCDETARATVRCVLEDSNDWTAVTAGDVFDWALDAVEVVS